MNTKRVQTAEISIFKTFDGGYRVPHYLDCQSKSGDLTILSELPNLGLAIVGSRSPQKRSVDLLEKSMAALAPTNLIVVSGFANGIDAHAHEFAIHFGLRTIAILGCGIEVDYPKSNQRLRDRILDSGGLVISQFEKNDAPLARNFHNRNALIAGFSKAVWVVEAAEVSGTLNTASWANRFNRDLYATSCFPEDPFYLGNLKLLTQKETHRYPVAHAFYNTQSFESSWSELGLQSNQNSFSFSKVPPSKIQKWVLELKSEYGVCQIQALLNYAHSKGQTLGAFYQEYEKDLNAGLLTIDEKGRVDAAL